MLSRPRWFRAHTKALPMKPAPPVTKTRPESAFACIEAAYPACMGWYRLSSARLGTATHAIAVMQPEDLIGLAQDQALQLAIDARHDL